MQSRRRLPLVAVLAIALLGAAHSPEAAQRPIRPLRLDDYYRVVNVGSPAMSPDGTRVAVVVTTVLEDENRRHRAIWLADTDGVHRPRRVTNPAHEASSPVWSPDGSLLAFNSRRSVPGGTDGATWFLDMNAGGEAYQIPGVEGSPIFSPDGRWIAYTRPTASGGEAAARTSRRGRYELATVDEAKIEERFTGRAVEWMGYRYDGRGYLADPRDPAATPPRELWVVPGAGGAARQLTRLGIDVSGVAWSPDSNRLVFSADEHQRDEHSYERPDLWLVDLAGTVTRLTDDGWSNGAPVWSPGGDCNVFRRSMGLDMVIEQGLDHGSPVDLSRTPVEPADPASAEERMTNLTAEWGLRPGAPTYVPNGRAIRFVANIGGQQHLFELDAAGGAVRQVTEGRRWLSGFSGSADGRSMAFTSTTATMPTELWRADASGAEEAKLSWFNDSLTGNVRLSGARPVQYSSTDGTRVEGWLVLPADYRADRGPYPLILSLHGGPHSAYGERFSLQFQLLATLGYAVLYTNPRGSTGYGEDFLWATWGGGWGRQDYEDVMAGVGHVVETYAIDPARLGVTGYSYGGFLTDWIITQTDRFAAAAAGAGISNWISDYGTADIPRTKESEFYGPPWKPRSAELLWEQSPIKHADGVSTPTLFLHGESDFRVPIEQAEQMYTALRKQQVPARFVRYPGTSHGGWSPWDTVHRYHEEIAWWQRWLSEE